MKLFMIIFNTIIRPEAQVYSYVEDSGQLKPRHLRSDGFQVSRETSNCWFLDHFPEGMPKQYRKADEYRVINNSSGIYMFGRDSEKLMEEWNRVVVA